MLNIRGMSTADSLLGVMVHRAALLLHCEAYPHCCLTAVFGWGSVNARPDPVTSCLLGEQFAQVDAGAEDPMIAWPAAKHLP